MLCFYLEFDESFSSLASLEELNAEMGVKEPFLWDVKNGGRQKIEKKEW